MVVANGGVGGRVVAKVDRRVPGAVDAKPGVVST